MFPVYVPLLPWLSALKAAQRGCLAGPDAIETGDELFQPKFEFTRLLLSPENNADVSREKERSDKSRLIG